jgi:hypothetical protein
MAVILNDIVGRHGSILNYVREIGVSDDAARALTDALTS